MIYSFIPENLQTWKDGKKQLAVSIVDKVIFVAWETLLL